MRLLSFIGIVLITSYSVSGQFLFDETAKNQVSKAYDKLYNEEWYLAEEILQPIYVKYKNHPVSHLIKASVIQMKNVPIESNPKALSSYLSELENCKVLAEKMLSNSNLVAEATFYLLAAHGYIAQVNHNKGDFLKAAYEGRKAYSYMKDGFELVSQNPEFNFTNGLYNFYREQYPETHGEIKPVVMFFSKGNKSKGLIELNKARTEALFTKHEAAFMLVGIYLKYINDNRKALEIARSLHKSFPRNDIFLMKYIESLIASGNINQAKLLLNQELKPKTELLKLARWLFLGQCERDNSLAKAYFANAIKIKAEGRYVQDYKSMAYFGLSQGFYKDNELASAKLMLKEAEKIAEYKSVKAEVDALKKIIL